MTEPLLALPVKIGFVLTQDRNGGIMYMWSEKVLCGIGESGVLTADA